MNFRNPITYFKKRSLNIVYVLGSAFFSRKILSIAFINKENSLIEAQNNFEKQFQSFASIENNGILYMTAADFILSLVAEKSLSNHLKSISDIEVECELKKTPSKLCSRNTFLRDLGDGGLIPYTEYIFLLCLLNKPTSGFDVAFRTLDTDDNGTLDRHEFKRMHQVAGVANTKRTVELGKTGLKLYADDEISYRSTLMRYLFGKNENNKLSCKEFISFINNLQNEVLEVEFLKHSTDGQTISAIRFAEIFLYHTKLPERKYPIFLNRLMNLLEDHGIRIADYKNFFLFLNNLDDLQMAMKMYLLANKQITFNEFKRAIKACSNVEISDNLLKVVFCLFDENADGLMSAKELMVLLKNRRKWGLSKNLDRRNTFWMSYKSCFREEVSDD